LCEARVCGILVGYDVALTWINAISKWSQIEARLSWRSGMLRTAAASGVVLALQSWSLKVFGFDIV
jgi:hypothetical protein